MKKVTNVPDDGTYFPISITVSTFGHIDDTTIDNYMFTTVIPRSETDDVPEDKPTVYFDKTNGIFWMKKDAQIVIANVPKGAKVTALETDFDDIDVGKFISRETGTEFYFDAENCRIVNDISHSGPSDRFVYANAEVGAQDLAITIANKYIGVKATIRVKYAPSYYDFEHNTNNVKLDTYKTQDGIHYNNVSLTTACTTEFTDSDNGNAVIGESTIVETAVRSNSETFNVEVGAVNTGSYLFIGWYDELGNRYNNDDATQHEFTASAPKDKDRIFEARFITAPTYRLDFKVPTRLWGERIYKVFGKVKNSMISHKYIGYDSTRDDGQSVASSQRRYYLTGLFVHDNTPFETIFLQTINWPNIDDGKQSTQYNIQKTVTTNTGSITNVETTVNGTNTYNLYRYVEAQMTDQQVTVKIFNDYEDRDTAKVIETVDYGSSINNNATVAVNIPSNKTFWRWKIETLKSLGKDENGTVDGTLVTYDYSKNFNYVAYDNYKVTVEVLDKEQGGTEYSPYASKEPGNPYYEHRPTNESTVIVLGQTRNHWNDTVSGEQYVAAQGESTKHPYANNDVDRLFIDLGLSYSDGNETKLNTVDKTVGFIIEYQNNNGEWAHFKTVTFSSRELGDKNRIEYYYDIKNTATNRSVTYRVTPIIEGERSGDPVQFDFKKGKFGTP